MCKYMVVKFGKMCHTNMEAVEGCDLFEAKCNSSFDKLEIQ